MVSEKLGYSQLLGAISYSMQSSQACDSLSQAWHNYPHQLSNVPCLIAIRPSPSD